MISKNSIYSQVRRIINDTVEPKRWSDSELQDALNLAIARLNYLVPVTRYIGGKLASAADFAVTQSTTEIPIAKNYEEAMVYYIVNLCYSKDDPDTSNAELANLYAQKAERLMV